MEKVLLNFYKVMQNKAETLEKEIPEFRRVLQAKEGELAVTKTYMKILTDLLKEQVDREENEPIIVPVGVELELEKETRMKAGVCAHRERIKSGEYNWCDKKRVKRKRYCKKHNAELGL